MTQSTRYVFFFFFFFFYRSTPILNFLKHSRLNNFLFSFSRSLSTATRSNYQAAHRKSLKSPVDMVDMLL